MPIRGVRSFPTTMQEYLAHWDQANAALRAEPLVLKGYYTIADFGADRAAIVAAIDAAERAAAKRRLAETDQNARKVALRRRVAQFRAMVKGPFSGSFYEASLPRVPRFSDDPARFLRSLADVAELWKPINAEQSSRDFSPPLLLVDGYALDDFLAEVATLRAVLVAGTTASLGAETIRDRRDLLLRPVVERMEQYRRILAARFDPTHPLFRSVPVLRPDSIETPDPVILAGAWDDDRDQALLTWTASPHPELDHYSIRTAPGPIYVVQEERTLGTAPADSIAFTTAVGLFAPGTDALFKVYVVTHEGIERGSNTVRVSRP